MKKLFVIALLIVRVTTLHAQSAKVATLHAFSNAIGISTGVMFFPGGAFCSNPFSQIGFTYDRKVYRTFFISADYNFWNQSANLPNQKYSVYKPNAPFPYAQQKAYKSVDLVPEYQLHSKNYKDILTFGAGVSYTWGKNRYSDFVAGIQEERQELYTSVSYYGTTLKTAYTHFFCKNRIGIGAEARYRYYFSVDANPYSKQYFGINEGEYDFNANLKVNF
jgi:hypothetical protein